MIRIVVDSASDYCQEDLKAKQIDLIPISITIGENEYMDGVNLQRDELYQIMESTGEFPKTSQPSPQTFLELFKGAKESGDSVIYSTRSSALSGTYQSALLAKNMADYDQIYLIDSLSATYTIKVMADYACRLRDEGETAEVIVQKIESLKSHVKVIAALDTLEYLKRGGRIGAAAAAIGELVNIKPLITLSKEGNITVLGKCMGRNKAISTLVKHIQDTELDSDFPIYTIYSYGTDNCRKFTEKLTAAGYAIEDCMQIGPTIGTHIGPEAFGAIFVTK